MAKGHIHGHEVSLSVDHLPLLRDVALWGRCESTVRRLFGLPTDARRYSDARLTGHIEWQRTRDEGVSPIYNGEELTYHPSLRGGLRLEWIQERWRLNYNTRYRAASYWSRRNLPAYQSPPQWNHDLSVHWQVCRPGVTLALRIDNLTDGEQEDMRGYPLPGRAWFGGIELDFHGPDRRP